MTPRTPRHVRVDVAAAPAPGLLRAAIERRLAGGSFPTGPEDAVAQAVARVVREASNAERGSWR
ncbi:MAG TPA: hypothetical protein VIM23_04830 [Gaiellaceae bacterium]